MHSWISVLFAAIVEVFWVLGLKFSDTALEWAATVLAIIITVSCIIKACEKLPAGTVYAVFTGSGAAAIALLDFTIFGAEFTYPKVLFIGLIILGVIGIKITTDENEPEDDSEAADRRVN